jgi:hypothetical protein
VVVYRVADGATLQAVLDAQTGGVLAGPAPYNVVSPLADRFAQLGAEVDVWDLAGQPLAHLPLPAGIVIGELGPWSPDAATLLLGGCQPCNLLGKGPDATTRVHIHVLPVDGSPLRTLGDELIPDGFDPSFVDPAWSPDGASIAASLTGIVVVDAESGRITRLTSSGLDVQPAWSPDGSRIAYVVSALDGQGIWVMAADGSNPIRLTTATTEFGDRLPVWSPDGSTVLFTRGMQNAFGDLWQVPSTGGTPGLVLSNAVAGW